MVPNQIASDIDFRHKITTTYDATTLILLNSKIFHPKQSDSNNKLKHTYNNPISTISDMGSPTQSNGSSNGGLRIVSCETKYTQKVLRVLGPRSSGGMGKTHITTNPL